MCVCVRERDSYYCCPCLGIKMTSCLLANFFVPLPGFLLVCFCSFRFFFFFFLGRLSCAPLYRLSQPEPQSQPQPQAASRFISLRSMVRKQFHTELEPVQLLLCTRCGQLKLFSRSCCSFRFVCFLTFCIPSPLSPFSLLLFFGKFLH